MKPPHMLLPDFEIDFRQNKSLSENKPNPFKLSGCKDWSWLYHLEDFEQLLVSLETSITLVKEKVVDRSQKGSPG